MLTDENLVETIKRLHEVLTTDNEFKPASLSERFGVDGNLLVQICEYTFTLQQQQKQMKEALEWAARIIDSGMGAGFLRYDPVKWFIDSHKLRNGESLQGGTDNAGSES